MSISSNVTEQKIIHRTSVRTLGSGRVWQQIDWRTSVQTLVVLFKLRIVLLLLFAAVGGAFLGTSGWPGAGDLKEDTNWPRN